MLERLKARVHEIMLIPSKPGDRAGHLFDVFIITLIALNVLAVVVETMPEAVALDPWLYAFELASVVVFIVEYALRFWTATADPRFQGALTGRLRWAASPYALIDLVAILPVLAVGFDLRFVRVLRVLRVLKLGRYSESLQILTDVMRRSARDLATSLFLVVIALVLSASFMYYAERGAQPDVFASIPDAMWWGIVTLTTTGYGDMVPITTMGRVVGGVTVLLGIAALALPIGILSSAFVEELRARRGGLSCPHCGKGLKHGNGP